MSSDDEYNKRAHARMQEELAELDRRYARYQAQLDRHWEAQRALDEEEDDLYEVGGFLERKS